MPPPGSGPTSGCWGDVSQAPCTVEDSGWDIVGLGTVALAWLAVIVLALLVLRAVCLDDLDGEQDGSDDEVSGHVPS